MICINRLHNIYINKYAHIGSGISLKSLLSAAPTVNIAPHRLKCRTPMSMMYVKNLSW